MSCPFAVNPNAIKSEIRGALINDKVNACPMAIRVAWHASGTYDAASQTGGSNGGTMRFQEEANDGANAGLSIIRDMLHPVQKRHPELSSADIWTAAGAAAVEFTGGPQIAHKYGRTDAPDGSYCPPNGRLPDAKQGAAHLRDVFYRMGFNDQEIVALSGAHTLGRCHMSRSGFDGPWTTKPLNFDNEYFRNLMNLEWRLRVWDGPEQYEDVATSSLMMLPTDYCLRTDPSFSVFAAQYAADEQLFFRDFSVAFSKLLALGTPAVCHPEIASAAEKSPAAIAGEHFREHSMHGSLEKVLFYASKCDINEMESTSGRTALHKAAFWGHSHIVKVLLEMSANADCVDYNGDTALHDAARFAHDGVVQLLLAGGANKSIENKQGQTPLQVAEEYGTTSTANKHDIVIAMLK